MATRLDRRISAADLDGLPHEWDTLYELIGGVLHMSRRPPLEHQVIVTRLIVGLGPLVIPRGGMVVAEPGIVWEPDGEDNVAPDAAVILSDLPAPGSKLRRCPEIVVEIVSAGHDNRRRDYIAKRDLYWRRGATEYWIIDPEERAIHQLARGASEWQERVLRGEHRLQTPLVPDWAGIAVNELL